MKLDINVESTMDSKLGVTDRQTVDRFIDNMLACPMVRYIAIANFLTSKFFLIFSFLSYPDMLIIQVSETFICIHSRGLLQASL